MMIERAVAHNGMVIAALIAYQNHCCSQLSVFIN